MNKLKKKQIKQCNNKTPKASQKGKKELLLLLQKTGVWFQASTNSSFRRSAILLWLPRALAIYATHISTCRQDVNTYKIKISKP